MSKVAGVIDVGGNDEYYATDLRLGNSVIIDIAGDDKYSGTADQGPASALLGISYIDDRAGNDHYQGKLLSTGAAMFGVSLLLDRSGEDSQAKLGEFISKTQRWTVLAISACALASTLAIIVAVIALIQRTGG